MRVLLYGVTQATAPDPDGDGFGGRQLRALTHRGLKAVISDVATAPPWDPRHMWAYNEIVERLAQDAPVLPARYGTIGEEPEIARMLAARERELAKSLNEVGDAVEFVVHPSERGEVREPDDPVQPATPRSPGTEYMRRRGEHEHALRHLEAIAAPLTRCPPRRMADGIACLVDRTSAERFARRVAEHGALAFGPWPPFSFVP